MLGPTAGAHKAGEKALAFFQGKLIAGKIQAANDDGTTYDILFDNGKRDPAVAHTSIQARFEVMKVKGEQLHFTHGGAGAKRAVPIRRKELDSDQFEWSGITFVAGALLADLNLSKKTLKCVCFDSAEITGAANFAGLCQGEKWDLQHMLTFVVYVCVAQLCMMCRGDVQREHEFQG